MTNMLGINNTKLLGKALASAVSVINDGFVEVVYTPRPTSRIEDFKA